MDWKIPVAARRLLTMLPAMIVLASVRNTSDALVYSQIALSFGIPFALIPLPILSRDPAVMGSMVNRRITTATMAATSAVIIVLNVALVGSAIAAL
jgi:manganese transport protein